MMSRCRKPANPRWFFYGSLCLIAGILLAKQSDAWPGLAALGLLALSLLLAVFLLPKARFFYAGLLCALLAGTLLGSLALGDAPVYEESWAKGSGVTISGRICRPVYCGEKWTEVTLDHVTVTDGSRQIELNKHVELHVRETSGMVPLQYGDILEGTYRLYLFETPANPLEPDYYTAALARGSGYYAYTQEIGTAGRQEDIYGFFVNIREKMLLLISQSSAQENTDFLSAITVGEQRGIDANLRQTFSASGLSHVLSVSGLHIGLLLVLLKKLLGLLPLRRPGRFAILVFFIGSYCALTAFATPVVRAGIMAGIWLLADLTGKRYDFLNSLGMTAMIILLIQPLQAFTVGFQLSFCACLGIALFTNTLHSKNKLLNKGAQAVNTSLGAGLLTLPLVAYYFNIISLISLVANFLLVPLASLITGISFTSSVVGLFHQGLGELGLRAADWLTGIFLGAVKWIGSRPWASLQLATPPFWAVLAILLLLFFVSRYILLQKRIKAAVALLTAAVYIGACMGVFFLPRHGLQMNVLSVGNALSVHIQTDGKNYLVDTTESTVYAGGEDSSAEWDLLPYLHNAGITYLDGVFISHENADHCGGLYVMLEEIKIGTIYYPQLEGYSTYFTGLLEKYRQQGTRCVELEAGDTLQAGSLWWEVLNPIADSGSPTENGCSLVMKLTYEGVGILFPGDIPQKVETQILAQADVSCDILIAAHHGSHYSTSEAWLEEALPRYAVLSEGGRYPDSVAQTTQRLQDYDIMVFDTDTDGAAMFHISENGQISAQTMR